MMKKIVDKLRSRFFLLTLAIFLMTALPVFYNNCGNVEFMKAYGVSTIGNPLSSTQASQEILFAICSVLDRCQAQVPFNTCMTGILATSGIASTLGLPSGTYDPYSSL